MERDVTFSDSPILPSDASSPAAIYFCPTCEKPFTSEPSQVRHSRYCGTRPRNRPRSCRACNAAKTKCSFEAPCWRCAKKGIECVYDESAAGRRTLLRPFVAAQQRAREVRPRSSRPSTSSCISLADARPSHMQDGILFDEGLGFGLADDLGLSDAQMPSFDSPDYDSLILSTQSPTLDALLTFSPSASDVSAILCSKTDPTSKSGSWCSWMRPGFSLAIVTSIPTPTKVPTPTSNVLAILQVQRSRAHSYADVVIQSLRSFPTMMLRRETFPWFIHPHSHLLSQPARASLPEALSACIGISQLFTSRTSETKYFLWRTIRAEHRRSRNDMHKMDKMELLAAVQACMIYLIMCIVDYSVENEGEGLELLLTLHDISALFKEVLGRPCSQSEMINPSLTWAEWIFNESQRRLAALWFLIGCVVCVKTGTPCDPSQSYRALALPGPKSLWEAPTQAAWEAEYEATQNFQVSRLLSLGDLIDAQQSDYTPLNAQKLDRWNAGADNCGFLLSLVGNML